MSHHRIINYAALVGTLPTEIGALKNLSEMSVRPFVDFNESSYYRSDLRSNNLGGTLSAELGQLTRLTHLFVINIFAAPNSFTNAATFHQTVLLEAFQLT